jgi:hypothetical protein
MSLGAVSVNESRGAQNQHLEMATNLQSEPAAPRCTLKHYTVAEIAAMWAISDDVARALFQNEPGVLVIGDPKPSSRKRRYTTLRIPEDVLERVHKRMCRY